MGWHHNQQSQPCWEYNSSWVANFMSYRVKDFKSFVAFLLLSTPLQWRNQGRFFIHSSSHAHRSIKGHSRFPRIHNTVTSNLLPTPNNFLTQLCHQPFQFCSRSDKHGREVAGQTQQGPITCSLPCWKLLRCLLLLFETTEKKLNWCEAVVNL